MAVITPSTDLKLLKVPLEINDINQLTFANQTAQFNYFNSLSQYDVDDDFTYQRYDGTIRFPAQYDEILTYNYVMYKNTAYSDKWFYAFITNIEYVNDNMTAITIKCDVWQTWQFQLNYKPVLIDREHANTDVPGDNLLPEQLELGEFTTNGTVSDFGLWGGYCTVIDVTQIENTGESATMTYAWSDGGTYAERPLVNGMPSGLIHLIVGYYAERPDVYIDPNYVIKVYDYAGLGGSIVNVYAMPKDAIGEVHKLSITATRDGVSHTAGDLAIPANSFNEKINAATFSFSKPTSVDGYTPKNKKVLTAPYCYFDISNNGGMSQPYYYEDFSTNTCNFKIAAALSPSGSIKAYPLSYKNIDGTTENSYDYGITGAKYPIGAWVNDAYTNWLTQNAVNMKIEWAKTLIGAGVGIASGTIEGRRAGAEVGAAGKFGTLGAIGGAAQGAMSIVNTALDQHLAKTQANMVADQAGGNVNCGDIMWAKNRCKFTYLPMSIKAQFARCIDEFFSQYGYKCNRVKIPNITGRRNWNYVKTIGCYIEADIPQNDLAEIKAMFDNGITLWHNPSTFADYSQNNDII